MKINPDQKMIEEKLNLLQPAPSPRFYRRMRRAPWTLAFATKKRVSLSIGAILAVLMLLLSITPQGRAWAQETITKTISILNPATEMVELPLDYEQASEQVGFKIYQLTSLPEGYGSWLLAYYPDDHHRVCSWYGYGERPAHDISYGWANTGMLILCQEDPERHYEGSQTIEYSGDYVSGINVGEDGELFPLPVTQSLLWRQNGLAFNLSYVPDTREMSPAPILTIAEFIVLAGSVH